MAVGSARKPVWRRVSGRVVARGPLAVAGVGARGLGHHPPTTSSGGAARRRAPDGDWPGADGGPGGGRRCRRGRAPRRGDSTARETPAAYARAERPHTNRGDATAADGGGFHRRAAADCDPRELRGLIFPGSFLVSAATSATGRALPHGDLHVRRRGQRAGPDDAGRSGPSFARVPAPNPQTARRLTIRLPLVPRQAPKRG